MIKRWFLRSLLTLALLLMLMLGALVALISSEAGTGWLLNQAASYTPLSVKKVRGSLLAGVSLYGLHYSLGKQDYRAAKAHLRWHPLGILWGALWLDQLHLSGLHIAISPSKTKTEKKPLQDWPDIGIPFVVIVRDIKITQTHMQLGQRGYFLESLSGNLRYGPSGLQLDEVTLASAGSRVELNGRADLHFPYALKAQLDWQLHAVANNAKTEDVMRFIPASMQKKPQAGTFNISGDINALKLALTNRKPVALTAQGTFTTGLGGSAATPKIAATMHLPQQRLAQWGLSHNTLSAASLGGKLTVDGWLNNYRTQFSGSAELPDYPPLAITVNGMGDSKHFVLDNSDFELAKANLSVTGQVSWQQGITWQLYAGGAQINPALVLPQWPGKLATSIRSQGHWGEHKKHLNVQLQTLQGQLRSLAVMGHSALNYNGTDWTIAKTHVSFGANQLDVSGHLGESFAVNWDLKAPLLAQIDPAIGGSLQVGGKLTGNRVNPQLTANAQGHQLRFKDYRLKKLTLTSHSGALKANQWQLSAKAAGLSLAGTALQSVRLDIAGDVSRHDIKAHIVQDQQDDLTLALAGGWNGSKWRGAIKTLDINTAFVSPLALRTRVPLQVSSKKVAIQSLCLVGGAQGKSAGVDEEYTDICASGQWRAAGLTQASLKVKRLPLALAHHWLKQAVSVKGYLVGGGQLHWPTAKPLAFKLDLQAKKGELIYGLRDDEHAHPEHYPITTLALSAQKKSADINASAKIHFKQHGDISAKVHTNTHDRSLTGGVDLALASLQPFAALLPEVRNISGTLNAHLKLAGKLDKPSARVDAQLNNGAIDIPRLGINLASLQVAVTGNQNKFQVRSSAKAGEGELHLKARGQDVFSDNWQVNAALKGENAKLLDIPALTLSVTPDIKLEASAQKIKINGSAKVPMAHAVITTLPVSATKTSSDVVVIDNPEPAHRQGIPLYMTLAVNLGEDVTLQAAGLNARLGGDLTVQTQPSRPLYAVGNIDIIHGRYKAYGQDLTVEKGSLSFQGPMDNPGLNVTATRNVNDTTVGLNIAGTLQKPVTDVFSRPHTSESNAMSMLFTGKPLGGASSGEGAMLVNAIAKLGIKRGQFLADDIASRLGLDELTVKAGDSVQGSQLWLGKYLSKDLYVHYAVGLFDSVSNVGFTYFINKNFRIEAESGAVQSADLLYQLEK